MKREPFDLSVLKSKIENLSKGHGECAHGEGEACRDYLLDYPLNQRRCVAALEKLDEQRSKVEAEFRAEVQELEKKYLAKYQPLYADRAALIKGEREALPEEYGQLPEVPVQEVDENGGAVRDGAGVAGIPRFWLTALQNHPAVAEMIREQDAPALAALEDITVGHLETGPGFRLEFLFGENAFFTNRSLVKEYHLAAPTSPLADDYIYDHATGTQIAWKAGKNLCFKTVTKTQRQKTGKGTRVVTREELQDSFFHFFAPPTIPEEVEDSEDEADVEELEQELEADYEIGDLIKCEIVPNAVHWFTGKALEYADYDDYFDEEEEDDEGSDEEDSDEEDSEESESEPEEEDPRRRQPRAHRGAQKPHKAAGASGAAGADQQQCKQQ